MKTVTPWFVSAKDDSNIFADDGSHVAACAESSDAAHIVRCVNAHDDLLAALRDMLELRDATMQSKIIPEKPELEIVAAARAAIAKATQ